MQPDTTALWPATTANGAGPRVRGPQASGLSRLYVGAWLGIAAASLAYTTSIALMGPFNGGTDTAAVAPSPPAGVQMAAPPQAVQAAETRAMKLKVTLEDFQRDLAAVRGDVETSGTDKAILARLEAIEERLSIETGIPLTRTKGPNVSAAPPVPTLQPGASTAAILAAAPPAAPPPTAPSAPAPAAATVQAAPVGPPGAVAPTVIATLPAAEPPSPPDLRPTVSAIETGSLQRPAAAAVKPPPVPAPGSFAPVITRVVPAGTFAVQFGAAASVDELRQSWAALSAKHPDALRSLEPRVMRTPVDGAGAVFELMAGPFRSEADARRACRAMAAQGAVCTVAVFAGDAL